MNGQEIKQIKRVLGTLIAWMSQSADRTISPNECEELLKMLNKKPRRRYEKK